MSPYGSYPFYDFLRWKQQINRIQQQQQRQFQRKPAFYFQDQSTFYYMSDPIYTVDKRLTIQLTKVHIGLNGEQQRVFVEQEFRDENQLKKFIKNLHVNFYKTFEKQETNEQKPGVFVVEEPDEEPKTYSQDENDQRLSMKSSCSTIYSTKRQRNYMKYRKSPPRFQKEKEFYSHTKPNIYPSRQRYPRTIADNLKFASTKIHQPRINQSKSNCQMPTSIPFQSPMTFYHLFQYNTKSFQCL